MKFLYKDNSEKNQFQKIEIEAENILEADKIFKEKTGFDVMKCAWISVCILPV